MADVPSLARMLQTLQQVPYLASKNLYRVASHFLKLDEKSLEEFSRVLLETRKNLTACSTCFYWKEREGLCIFCSDDQRDQRLVCVVETWCEVLAIERTRAYSGVYHVLGGAIYPLNGVGPEDLTIDQLVSRVGTSNVAEIIFAMSQTPEGEATASFIATKLKGASVTMTCLASGMPVGASVGYMDRVTVHKALSGRRPF